jgi:hypothetical protein
VLTNLSQLLRGRAHPAPTRRTNALVAGFCLVVALGHAYGKENSMTSKQSMGAAATENKSSPIRRSVQTASGPHQLHRARLGASRPLCSRRFAEQPFVASPAGGFVGYQTRSWAAPTLCSLYVAFPARAILDTLKMPIANTQNRPVIENQASTADSAADNCFTAQPIRCNS